MLRSIDTLHYSYSKRISYLFFFFTLFVWLLMFGYVERMHAHNWHTLEMDWVGHANVHFIQFGAELKIEYFVFYSGQKYWNKNFIQERKKKTDHKHFILVPIITLVFFRFRKYSFEHFNESSNEIEKKKNK